MNINAVILHYGQIEDTEKCVKSIEKEKGIKKIVVVNNDSKKDIKNKLGTSKVIVLNTKKNLGFAKGVNHGIKYALSKKADAILLLNNDASMKKGSVKRMIEVLTPNDIGLVAPIIQFKKDDLIFYDHGGKIHELTGNTAHDNRRSISGRKNIQVDFVSGCCMMLKSKLLKEIGLFDEKFFMYFEDVDLCIRTREVGCKVVVVPSSHVSHDLSEDKSSKTIYHLIRSSKEFSSKYSSKYPLSFVIPLKKAVLFSLIKPQVIPTIFRALFN